MSNVPEIDTSNRFLVGAAGERIVLALHGISMSKADALNLAANLVALADDRDEFPAILEAVRNT